MNDILLEFCRSEIVLFIETFGLQNFLLVTSISHYHENVRFENVLGNRPAGVKHVHKMCFRGLFFQHGRHGTEPTKGGTGPSAPLK
jgi:hypothetical protein